MYSSLEKFGQFVRNHHLKQGMTQKELSLKIFDRPNSEYVGRLERGTLEGITFSTVDKILMVLNSEMRFEKLPTYVPELHRRYMKS